MRATRDRRPQQIVLGATGNPDLSTRSVIAMEKTPSLNATVRPVR
jgi:hypothetical protein